jgi:hypothetical protein
LVKTPNYRQQKRQKELARKSRQAEKLQVRQPRATDTVPVDDPAAPPAATSPASPRGAD